MSTIIYYFSATGNSLMVAKDLANELGDTKIIPLAKAIKDSSEETHDVVGVVYPVYMFGLPLIVADFLKKIKIKKNCYIFCVATLGGLVGRSHTLTKNILKKRGIELAAGFSVLMPGNYTPLYGAIPQEKQQKMFAEEKQRVKEIADFVHKQNRGLIEEKPFWPNFLLYALLYKGGSSMIPKLAKDFWITDSCTKCGICAKVCPVNNIKLHDGHPLWLDHCEHCMACLQWCPVEAIQYKKSTIGRKRYHHPDVNINDIIINS